MNNLKKLAILCVMGVSCTAAAAACTTAEHTHTLEEHSANGATCTEAGNSAYWECGECHKYFSDADGKTEIARGDRRGMYQGGQFGVLGMHRLPRIFFRRAGREADCRKQLGYTRGS